MRYPQAYLLVDPRYELPEISVLQKWSLATAPIYVKGVSHASKVLDERINAIKVMHKYLDGKSCAIDNVIVVNNKSLGYFLILALGTFLKKVYWIDDAAQAKKILGVNWAIEAVYEFDSHLDQAHYAYSELVSFISENSEDKVFPDEQIDRLFESRMWGARSTAEHHLKRIAKNETRAGILQRLDL